MGVAALLWIPNMGLEILRWNQAKKICVPHTPQFTHSFREVFAGTLVSFLLPGRMGQALGRMAMLNPHCSKKELLAASALSSFYQTGILVLLAVQAWFSLPIVSIAGYFPFATFRHTRSNHGMLALLTLARILIFSVQWLILLESHAFSRIFQLLGSMTLFGFGPFGNLFIRENLALHIFPEITAPQILSTAAFLWGINIVFPAVIGVCVIQRVYVGRPRHFFHSLLGNHSPKN